jgi:class 3 adenylate cyclase
VTVDDSYDWVVALTEAKTVSAKYIFLDVVGFTIGRTVEDQTSIVDSLNKIVKKSVSKFILNEESIIYIPTGDGICISLINIDDPYDVHIKLALDILESIGLYNKSTLHPKRKFSVRVGINSNYDNLICDINTRKNLAGAGINTAQRLMSMGDDGHVIVGQSVYEFLNQREAYFGTFRKLTATVKHGLALTGYQLKLGGCVGLNVDLPTRFKKVLPKKPKLTEHLAVYFAFAIKYKGIITEKIRSTSSWWAAMVLLWLLSKDTLAESKATDLNPFSIPATFGYGKYGFSEQFDYYNSVNFPLCYEIALLIGEYTLSKHYEYFDTAGHSLAYVYINAEGEKILKDDWPDIWEKYCKKKPGFSPGLKKD